MSAPQNSIPQSEMSYLDTPDMREGTPHVSVDTWDRAQMSSFLADGLSVMGRRIGHGDHQSSLG